MNTEPKITVIYHRADYDGIFCYQIAKQFFTQGGYEVEYLGWDYGDPVPQVDNDTKLYMLDISVDGLMHHPNLNWVDHHKSAIEKFSPTIQGYRIDGVAACRLTWQYFGGVNYWGNDIPHKTDFLERRVWEPMAVRLAGEYDIWDHRGDGDLEFQFGLDAQQELNWPLLLQVSPEGDAEACRIVQDGGAAMQCYKVRDAQVMNGRSFLLDFEGMKFLVLNTARCNSNTFAARDVPETGHDALMAFYFNGRGYRFSLYHASHRREIDLSLIAVKYGGGGHRGACGFETKTLPF